MDEHLETLAGYVFDHDKLVTYKWLSKELQVHVNVAKQILCKFYEKHRKNNSIEFTHLLMGTLKDNGMRVEVVRESALFRAKEKFSKIISEHLYSVHKPLDDLELLASSGPGDVAYSAIKCNTCKERNDEEMHLLRWGTAIKKMENNKDSKLAQPTETEKKPIAIKKNGFNNFFNKTGKQKSPEMSKSTTAKEIQEFAEKSTDFPKHIDSMEKDKNSTNKNKDLMEKDKDSAKSSIKGSAKGSASKKVSPKIETVRETKKGGLQDFFNKMISSQKLADVEMPEKENNETVEKKSLEEEKKAKKKEKKHGKKRNRSQEESNGAAKKRKRIMIQSDSSDSELEYSDMETKDAVAEAEDETPVKPKSPSPPKVKHENGKRKVLKLVSKTYKEGEYMVTKKEHVYMSCSEDEEKEEKEKKKEPLPKIATKAEKTKKKQTTLTAFFKKS